MPIKLDLEPIDDFQPIKLDLEPVEPVKPWRAGAETFVTKEDVAFANRPKVKLDLEPMGTSLPDTLTPEMTDLAFGKYVESLRPYAGKGVTGFTRESFEKQPEMAKQWAGLVRKDRSHSEKLQESYKRGGKSFLTQQDYFDAVITGRGNPEKIYKQYKGQQALEQLDPIKGESLLTKMEYGTARILPGMIEGGKQALPEMAGGMAIGAMSGAAAAGTPTLGVGAPVGAGAGALAGLGIGFKVGSTYAWYKQGAGEMLLNMRDKGLTGKPARIIAGIAGIPYALIEQMQIGQITPGLRSGLNKAVNKSMIRLLGKAAAKYGKTMTQETLEEVAQEGVEILAEDLAQFFEKHDIKYDKKALKDRALRLWNTFKGAVVSMALLPGLNGVIDVSVGSKNIAKVKTGLKKTAENLSAEVSIPLEQANKIIDEAVAVSESTEQLSDEITTRTIKQMEDNVAEVRGQEKLDQIQAIADESELSMPEYTKALQDAVVEKGAKEAVALKERLDVVNNELEKLTASPLKEIYGSQIRLFEAERKKLEGSLGVEAAPAKVEGVKPFTATVYKGIKDKGLAATESAAVYGKGTYYTTELETAKQYGPDVKKSEVTLQKPLQVTESEINNLINQVEYKQADPSLPQQVKIDMEEENKITAFRQQLEEQGYDGIVIDKGKAGKEIIVFYQPVAQAKPAPAKMTRRTSLQLGHQIPKLLNWTERYRRNFMRQLVGKRSMKDMTLKQRTTVVDAMLQEAKKAGLSEEQYGGEKAKERVKLVINEKLVDIANYLDEAVDAVNDLVPATKKQPKRFTYRTAQKGKGGVSALGTVAAGIDNDHISALAKRLSGGKSDSITEILDGDRQRSMAKKSKHFRITVEASQKAYEEAEITSKDFEGYSRFLDPRMRVWAGIKEKLGVGKVKYHSIELNGKSFELSPAQLLDIYLFAQQEKGLSHLKESGLVIFEQQTGPLNDAQILDLMNYTEQNPKLKSVADVFTSIAEFHNAPEMNAVSNRLIKKDIAAEDSYWHLEVYNPKKMAGKRAYSISFLENQGLLKERTGTGEGALVVRDAFERFYTVQSAVAEYVGMAEHNRTATLLLSYTPFASAIKDKGYGGVHSNIIKLYERASQVKSSSRLQRTVSGILHGAYRGIFTGNMPVIISQYSSTFQYASIIDKKYAHLIGHGSKPSIIKEMLKYNDVAWERFFMGHQSIEMAELGQVDATLKAVTGRSADINKVMMPMKIADILALADGWKVAKAMAKDGGLEIGSKEYWKRTNQIAEDLWLQTQPSWDKWNRSMNTSDPTVLRQTLFLFRSYYEKTLSILHVANATYRNSGKTAADKQKFAKAYGGVMTSLAINALIRNMISRLWKPDQDLLDLLYDMVTSPLPLIAMLGKPLQSIIRSKFVKVLRTGKQGYASDAIQPLALKIVNIILKAPGDFTAAAAYSLRGETEKAEAQIRLAIYHLYIGVGLKSGIPVYEINRWKRILNTGKKTGSGRVFIGD